MREICVLTIVGLISLSGCAFAPVKKSAVDKYFSSFERTQSLAVTPAKALIICRRALEASGYEILASDEQLGIVRTKPRAIPVPDSCDCGTWNGKPITGTADSTVVLRFKAEGAGSRIELDHQCTSQFSAQNLYGATTVREALKCASKGKIEGEVFKFSGQLAESGGVAK